MHSQWSWWFISQGSSGLWILVALITQLTHTEAKTKCRHFADDIFIFNFSFENYCILIQISQRFVLIGLIKNIPSLLQIKAWRLVSAIIWSNDGSPTHIYATRPHWVYRIYWCRQLIKKVNIIPSFKAKPTIEYLVQGNSDKMLCQLKGCQWLYWTICSVITSNSPSFGFTDIHENVIDTMRLKYISWHTYL